ncbi:MAG: acyl-CoA reductase [Bacteroidia bacterium]
MNINRRINAFIQLGRFLKQFSEVNHQNQNFQELDVNNELSTLLSTVKVHNPWFTELNVLNSFAAIANNLEEDNLSNWIIPYIYHLNDNKTPCRVVVIMAGNIPMVGFNDLLCVLLSGNIFVGKLAADDKILLPYIAKKLIEIEPELSTFIEFTEGTIKNIEAVIATGSNNSARYFEYYFGKYPSIIRKNRNSVAILNNTETTEELANLGNDIFQYFGLGCRNVSKLFVPLNYSFDLFYQSIIKFQDIIHNYKYGNNYEYNRTVYLMSNDDSLLDNNFLLLKKDTAYASPIGVLFYEFYNDLADLNQKLEKDKELLQCIVSNNSAIKNAILFGKAQCPALADYADGIDTMKFLMEL